MSVKRHTAYNVAGAVVPLLATLVTLPIYLRTIGEERYGVLIILWTLLGYFGLFDLGLGRAVTNRIAAFKDRTAGEREEVFWTALLMNLALGCIGAIVLWGAGALVFRYFIDVPGALTREVYDALPWMVTAFPLLLASSVMSGALMGREEFLATNAIGIATGLLIQVAPLVVALTVGPALPMLVVAVLGVRVLSGFALFAACMHQLPVGLRPRLACSHVRPLFGFGGWVTVTSIVAPLLTTLDRVFIGAIVGAQAVTYYAVPFSLATRVTILPGSLSKALFPRFSAQCAAEAGSLLYRSTRILVVVMLPPIVLGLWLMEPFLTAWMGKAFAERAAAPGQWIVIGLWMNVFAYPAYASIPARGRPDIVAKLQLFQVVPYLILLWLALSRYGVAGGAAVWALRNTIDAILLIQLARVDVRIWSMISQSFGFLLVGSLITFVLPPLSVSSLLAIAGLIAVIALWSWRVEKDAIAKLWNRVKARRTKTVVEL